MAYYPQFLNAMMVQAGYQQKASFQTTIQDVDCGFRTAFAWFAGGLRGYPNIPLYAWTIPYQGLTEAERQTLEAFFAQMQGRFGVFTYLDPAGNLCQYSEDFTQAAWEKNSVSVAQNGGASDPFGGTAASVLTSSAANGILDTYVLPGGGASGFTLCGSVWVKSSAAMPLMIGFVDSGYSVLRSQITNLPAGTWTRIWCQITLSTNSNVRLIIGGGNTWGTGVSLTLFGAQCAPSLGPGGYAKTPGDYGLHQNVRFDMDTLTFTKTAYNQNSATVQLREFYVGS